MINNFLLGSLSYSLLDGGIANIFCVETLSHGTNPIAYLNIRLEGSDNRRDLSIRARDIPPEKGCFYVLKEEYIWIHSIWPRYFAFYSAEYKCIQFLKDTPKWVQVLSSKMAGVVSCLFTPTLNFRFCKDELNQERFQNDEGFLGMPPEIAPAYATTKKIEAWRVGLMGSFCVGVNSTLLDRIKKDPQRVAKGIIQLAGAIFIISNIGTSAKTAPFITGFILG